MIFRHPKAVKQILNKNQIATLRSFPYQEGTYVKLKLFLGKKKIIKQGYIWLVVENPSREMLERYVQYSGFRTVDEWLSEAKRLHKQKPKYLVFITVD